MKTDQIRVVPLRGFKLDREDSGEAEDRWLEPFEPVLVPEHWANDGYRKNHLLPVPPRPRPVTRGVEWPIEGAEAALAALEDPELRADADDWAAILKAAGPGLKEYRGAVRQRSQRPDVVGPSPDRPNWYRELDSRAGAAWRRLSEQRRDAFARCTVKAREGSLGGPEVTFTAAELQDRRMHFGGDILRWGSRSSGTKYFRVIVWPPGQLAGDTVGAAGDMPFHLPPLQVAIAEALADLFDGEPPAGARRWQKDIHNRLADKGLGPASDKTITRALAALREFNEARGLGAVTATTIRQAISELQAAA